MKNRRFSLEEFKALFPGGFTSPQDLLREYDSFLSIFEQLDRMPVPELSSREKAKIFRRSWREPSRDRSRDWTWLAFLRKPAVAFAAGIILGCAVTLGIRENRVDLVPPVSASVPLSIERAGHTQTYRGKIVEEFYPQIENPKIVLEKTPGSSASRRILYGTLNDGQIYIVWNL